jgi:hypothetical protein
MGTKKIRDNNNCSNNTVDGDNCYLMTIIQDGKEEKMILGQGCF